MCDNTNISENILEAFEASEYSLWMVDYKQIYSKICELLPPRNTPFYDLSLENAIGCEIICAAICHQINWDFLRNTVYEMTRNDSTWIAPKELSKLSVKKVKRLLGQYYKPERIREKERGALLRSLGSSLVEMNYTYFDIFFSDKFSLKSEKEIVATINSIKAFSTDPEGKKTKLLLQNLSEYKELSALSDYCEPAIDYHIIREFLRRGLVIPMNQQAYEFILNPGIERKEKTVAGLRKVCSEFFYTLQWITSCNIITLNSIEWWIGRSVCMKEKPDCELKGDASQWLRPHFKKCPFYESCYAIQNNKHFLEVVEPNYQGNSY